MKAKLKDGTVVELRTQLPTGPHLRRIAKLEVLMQSAVAESSCRPSDQEWVFHFSLDARQGLYDHEPDFPQALQEYQDAVQRTRDNPSLHYLPPPEFMPEAAEPHRLHIWREGRRYPAIEDALHWLAAMYFRLLRQEPGVSLQEWNTLKTWFLTHWRTWKHDSPVHAILKRDEQKLEDLASDVEDDEGKSENTSKLIRHLRKLWACSYGA